MGNLQCLSWMITNTATRTWACQPDYFLNLLHADSVCVTFLSTWSVLGVNVLKLCFCKVGKETNASCYYL